MLAKVKLDIRATNTFTSANLFRDDRQPQLEYPPYGNADRGGVT
jgi:hypothetical protein